jgi:hypothetical protein
MATQLTITYSVDDLFDIVQEETLNIANIANTGQVDNIAITNNETGIFRRLLKQGANDAFKVFSVLCKVLTDGDVPIALDFVSDPMTLIYNLVPAESVNIPIYTPIFTNKLQDTIIKFIIVEWLRLKGERQWAIEKQEYLELKKELKSCAFHTQTPVIRKQRFL